MKLQHLTVFVAAAELSHLTRAARRLGMTQSAASAAVAALERDLGVKLFDRVNRSIALTAAGRVFLPEARAVLERAEAARRALRESVEQPVGEVRVAASQTIANYWLPARLARFRARYPGIRLDVAIGNTRTVARDVAMGRAEIGLVEGETADPRLSRRTVDVERPVLVVAADTAIPAWIGNRPDPRALPWVLREEGSGTRDLLEVYCRNLGLSLREITVALELPSNESVREAVEAGAGATIISSHVVAGGLAAGRLQAVAVDLDPREFALLTHAGRAATYAERLLDQALGGGD